MGQLSLLVAAPPARLALCLLVAVIVCVVSVDATPCTAVSAIVNAGFPRTTLLGVTDGPVTFGAVYSISGQSTPDYVSYSSTGLIRWTHLSNTGNLSLAASRSHYAASGVTTITALAAGDVDGQGLGDVVTCSSGGVRVFISTEPMVGFFYQISSFPSIALTGQPFFIGGASFLQADVDGDSALDFVFHLGANGPGAWIKNRNNTFSLVDKRPLPQLPAPFTTSYVQWTDLNAPTDAYDDFCVMAALRLDCNFNTGPVGNFSFGSPVIVMVVVAPFGLSAYTLGQINNDTITDIVLSMSNPQQLVIFLGNGTAFNNATIITPPTPGPVLILDVNADGYGDVFVGNLNTWMIINLGAGGGWAAEVSIGAPFSQGNFATCDFDLDGRQDIAVLSIAAGAGFKFLRNLGGGGPGVGPSWADVTPAIATDAFLSAPITRGDILCRDVNADGRPDVIINEVGGRLYYFINAPGPTLPVFLPPVIIAHSFNNQAFRAASIFGTLATGMPFFMLSPDFSSVVLFRQDPRPTFPLFTNASILISSTVVSSIAITLTDMDLDGDTDVVVIALATVDFLNQTSPLVFGRVPIAAGLNQARGLAVGNMDSVAGPVPEIAVAVDFANSILIYSRNASGLFTRTIGGFNRPGSLLLADLDGSGCVDLIFVQTGANSVLWMPNSNCTGAYSAATVRTIAVLQQNPTLMAFQDVDLDGFLDAILRTGQQVYVTYGGDAGGLLWSTLARVDSTSSQPLVIAANVAGGTELELVTASGTAVNYYPQLSTLGSYSQPFRPSALPTTSFVTGFDFNSDSYQDLLFAGSAATNPPAILLNNIGDASAYVTIPLLPVPSVAAETLLVAAGDFNSDGGPDAAVLAVTSQTVTFYLNFDGALAPTFVMAPTVLAVPFLNALELLAFDADKDGDTDLFSQNIDLVGMWTNTDGLGSWSYATIASGIVGANSRMSEVDLNGDFYFDLLVPATVISKIFWLRSQYATGNATWIKAEVTAAATAVWPSVGRYARGVDVDNDTFVDVVASSDIAISPPANPAVAYYRNLDGFGNFSDRIDIIAGTAGVPRSVLSFAAIDYDRNGFMDFTIYSGIVTNAPIALSYNINGFGHTGPNGSLVFSPPPAGSADKLNNMYSCSVMRTGDLNGDGAVDLVSAQGTAGAACTNGLTISTANIFWLAQPLPPRVITVEVARCGYTMSCIRDAIVAASRCNGDTVLVPAGRYGSCPSLSHIGISKTLLLTGVADNVIIDCTNSSAQEGTARLGFRVLGGGAVTITGITFINVATSELSFGGAAIRITDSSSVTLRRVNFLSGIARTSLLTSVRTPSLGFAGAVLLEDASTLVADNCTFADNTAFHSGGAIAAIGNSFSLTVTRSRFLRNRSYRSGGAIFVETSQAVTTSTVLISGCTFTGNLAIADPINDPSGTANGGDLATVSYQGLLNVRVLNTAFINTTASHVGGAISVFAATNGAVNLAFNASAIRGAISGEYGGGLNIAAQDLATILLSFNRTTFAKNSAVHSGGALSIVATRTPTGAPTVSASMTASSLVDSCSAGLDGGGLSLQAAISRDLPVGSASPLLRFNVLTTSRLSSNVAGRFGGAIATAGRVLLNVTGATVDLNSAVWGGVIAAYGTASGLDLVPPAVDSLSVLPAAEGFAMGCNASIGQAVFTATAFTGNSALYGGTAHTCESAVHFASATTFTNNRASHGGGFVSQCIPARDCDAPGNLCCASTEPSLLGAAWISVSPSFSAAYLAPAAPTSIIAALTAAVASDGFGPLVATPAVSLRYTPAPVTGDPQTPPSIISTGAALGSTVVTILDGFGQLVRDSAVTVDLRIASANAGLCTFVAGAPSKVLTVAPLSFGDVAIAIVDPVAVGQLFQLSIALAGSTFDPASAQGQALRVTSEVTVDICHAGYGVASTSSDAFQCAICPVGTFANASSLSPCRPCEGTSFNQQAGAVKCFACAPGTGLAFGAAAVNASSSTASLNCTCLPGYWSPRAGQPDEPCSVCPEGATCAGGTARPVAMPGWFPTDNPELFLPCPNPSACRGGGFCARGYEGRLCGRCVKGYYAIAARCVKCTNQTVPVMMLVCVLAVALVALLVWFNSRSDINLRFAAVMIGLNSLQISAMYGRLNLAWPDFARKWFDVISLLNLNLDLTSPECAAAGIDVWLLKYILTILLPVLFLVPFAMVTASALLYVNVLAPRRGWRTSLTTAEILDAAKRSYVQLASLLYMALCSMTLGFFRCHREKDGQYTLEAAPTKKCYDPYWWRLFPLAVVFAVVYSIGLPVLIFFLLTIFRRRAMADDSLWRFQVKFAFLVARFRDEAFRFEVSIMARKLGVVLAMTVFNSVTNKVYAAIIVMAGSLIEKLAGKPYRMGYHNALGAVCMCSSLLVLWGVINPDPTSRTVLVLSALGVNTIAILVGNAYDVYVLAKERASADKADRNTARDMEDEDMMVGATSLDSLRIDAINPVYDSAAWMPEGSTAANGLGSAEYPMHGSSPYSSVACSAAGSMSIPLDTLSMNGMLGSSAGGVFLPPPPPIMMLPPPPPVPPMGAAPSNAALGSAVIRTATTGSKSSTSEASD